MSARIFKCGPFFFALAINFECGPLILNVCPYLFNVSLSVAINFACGPLIPKVCRLRWALPRLHQWQHVQCCEPCCTRSAAQRWCTAPSALRNTLTTSLQQLCQQMPHSPRQLTLSQHAIAGKAVPARLQARRQAPAAAGAVVGQPRHGHAAAAGGRCRDAGCRSRKHRVGG